MPVTTIESSQVRAQAIQRSDLNTGTVGQAVVAKLIQGTNVTLSSTGADSGTGDVTISVPGGGTGPAGANSWTLTTASFTVPNVGSTVTVNVSDASWAVVGEYVWVATAGGSASQPMALQVTAKTPTSVTLLNPPTAGMQASGDAGNMLTLGSDSLLYLPPSAIQPTIWSARLRSFNSIGNPTMEVDQRFAGTIQSGAWGGGNFPVLDRWFFSTSSTAMRFSVQQTSGNVAVPGTNYFITQKFLRLTLTTVQATLAATDFAQTFQFVEGPQLRELLGDVHSVSLLVRSSVANLKFGLNLLSQSGTIYTLNKLCTLGAANTWTLVTLPNIPVWSPSATWPTAPANVGYLLGITLAAGSSRIVSANDVWVASSAIGAIGQSNFAASPVNSTFDIAFCQHSPGPDVGPTCLIDTPFSQSLDDCQRYYQKTYNYSILAGTADFRGAVTLLPGSGSALGPLRFYKPMALNPTVIGYSPNSGAAQAIYDNNGGVDRPITSYQSVGQTGFIYMGVTGVTPVVGQCVWVQYTADTGW